VEPLRQGQTGVSASFWLAFRLRHAVKLIDRNNALNALELNISDAVTLVVPASLQSITTYVLLEQESWFEKEMEFLRHWLRSGMTVIDIGANLGVYSLPMARMVGPTGQVFAYEPGSEPRAFLERSRELNAAVNLHISPSALSDREREGRLVFGGSSELSALGDSGSGETVRITNLDNEDAARGWPFYENRCGRRGRTHSRWRSQFLFPALAAHHV
jgi:FkbM family methyltransferase